MFRLPVEYSKLVESSVIVEPKSFKEAVMLKEANQWKSAMREEIYSLKENQTWDLVHAPHDANIIGCKGHTS